jgi:hypothetical protein
MIYGPNPVIPFGAKGIHLGRFIAALFASAQVMLQVFSSASIVRLQVGFGLPLLLLPKGFKSRACLVILF